jgi:hypothetical protein
MILTALTVCAFTVNAATVSGVVSDTNGAPLAGVYVTITPAGGGAAISDTTNATGDYSIATTVTGFHAMAATLNGFVAYAGFVNFPTAGSAVTRNITLTPVPPGITISGSVTDSATGNPLTGGIVRLSTIGGGATVIDSAVVGLTGTYSLTHVQAATYNLSATAAGHVAQTVRVVVAAAPLTRNFLLVGIPAGIVISGTVTDSVSGTGLVGATVTLRTGGAGGGTVVATATTITGGVYSIDSVQAGTYSLVATAAGHTAKTLNGIAVTNANLTRNFELVGLPAGVAISGSVIDSVSGLPLVGAIVRLRTAGGIGGGTLVDSAITIANGSYSIDSVQPGTYNLVASATGHINKTDAGIVVAAVALVRNFDLVRTPGIAISGRVADSASGLPLGGAIVRAIQAGVVIDSAIVANNGTYTLSVPAGTYTLTANAAGHGTKTMAGLVVNGALTENFFLVSGAVGTASAANTARMLKPEFSISSAGILQLRNFSEQGVVSVFSVNGKLVYRTGIAANATVVVLPKTMVGGLYLVNVTQKSAVYRKQVIMP